MKKRLAKRKPAKRRPRKLARVGSWRSALTELEAARRHTGQAAAALDGLASELVALRASAADAARLELARALREGPDGGPLALLTRLAASEDPADAPIARVARLLVDRMGSTLGARDHSA